MPIGEICNREVVLVKLEDSVLTAACLMRQHHVGDVLVVEGRNEERVPLGIVTDRDIIMEVVAPELDPRTITVGDIMALDFFTLNASAGISETIGYMHSKAVRRMPIVDDHGALVGIVTLDDLLVLLSEELGTLAKLVERERQQELVARH
ncbi:hypoxic response protein 1 [mine drainage metagenome]|uniref:Hypoxic response protein 1 n=1 Tax=mine drainage metagenome TaxID=410659 RepID=A0A1J5Q486_9ZZZZ